MSAADLNAQMTAAIAAFDALGDDLASATATQLSSLLSLFQTAYGTASDLQKTIATTFDTNSADTLFVSGVDPVVMASSLLTMSSISSSMVWINDIVNRLSRVIMIIQLAQLGIS